MFAAPPVVTTEVFAALPSALRRSGRPNGRPNSRFGNLGMHSFLEGPSFDRNGKLYTVDIAHGRIFSISPRGEFSLAAQIDGEPNGLKLHRDGTIYIADYINGILRMQPGGAPELLCAGPTAGERFHGVNDLFFASSGDLYFTDQGPSDMVAPTGRVFRIRAGEAQPELLLEGLPSPNGLVLTPDEKHLIFAVTKANAVWRAPLREDGTLGRVGVFLQLSGSAGGGPDGLAVDEQGNLAVAHPQMGVVWLFSPRGEPLLRIESCAGALTTNLAYGGPDRRSLFITESHSGSILRCDGLPAPGRAMFSHAN
jgi:gluconolactonase